MKKVLNYHKMFAVELIGKQVEKIVMNDSGYLIGIIFDNKILYMNFDIEEFEMKSLEQYKEQYEKYYPFVDYIIISKNEDGTYKYEENI